MRLRKQVVLDVMKKEISEVIETEYKTFLENAYEVEKEDSCIKINGDSINYNFKDWFYNFANLEEIFKNIYENGKVNYHGFEGKTFKDIYKYDKFKSLFYENFLGIVKEEVEGRMISVEFLVRYDILKKINDFLSALTNFQYEFYKIEREEISHPDSKNIEKFVSAGTVEDAKDGVRQTADYLSLIMTTTKKGGLWVICIENNEITAKVNNEIFVKVKFVPLVPLPEFGIIGLL